MIYSVLSGAVIFLPLFAYLSQEYSPGDGFWSLAVPGLFAWFPASLVAWGVLAWVR